MNAAGKQHATTTVVFPIAGSADPANMSERFDIVRLKYARFMVIIQHIQTDRLLHGPYDVKRPTHVDYTTSSHYAVML